MRRKSIVSEYKIKKLYIDQKALMRTPGFVQKKKKVNSLSHKLFNHKTGCLALMIYFRSNLP